MSLPSDNKPKVMKTTPYFLQQMHSSLVLGGGDLITVLIEPDYMVPKEQIVIKMHPNDFERLAEGIPKR